MHYAISYVSSANPELSGSDIQTILEFSKNWNIDHKISGILLFSEGNFFQVLEGDKDLLKELFSRIQKDSRHFNVLKIFEKEISEPEFDTYKTDFISLDSLYRQEDINTYFTQVESLNPSIQTSVKYILQNFAEGIK